MKYNKFIILIPTRERCETLGHTIRCCLNQTYQNLEVIVSDNLSQDDTKEVVMSFNDERLKYVNTGQRLSMSGNFDFALSHVKEGYVMFIGDDDGVLPNSLEYVNDIINATNCEAVTSYNAFYTWPNTSNQNQLFWSRKSGYEVRDTKEWVRRYLAFHMEYTFDLPGAYCGFVKREVFNKTITEDGQFFRSATPDAYSAIAVAFSLDKYVYSFTPFAVHGSSAKSNGRAYLSTSKDAVGQEFKNFNKENTIPFHPSVIITKSFRTFSAEAFMQFSDAFPQLTNGYTINWETLLKFVLTERKENTKDEIENAVKQMCVIYNLDYNDISSTAKEKFTLTVLKYKVAKTVYALRDKFAKKKIAIADTTKYGVYNVHDAMLLLKFYLNDQEQQ